MDVELKSQENLLDTHPVAVYMLPYSDRCDEISLIDLWRVIAARKVLIFASLLVAIVLAVTYAFLAEPLYRAEAYLLPPQSSDIQGLMIDYRGEEGFEIKRYTPDIVYNAFLRNFNSKGLRREFFDAHDLANYYSAGESHTDADIDAIFDTRFSDNLQVQAGKQDVSLMIASFRDPGPELAAQRINQFIAFASERTAHQLFNDVGVMIQAEIEQVRHQLDRKLKLAAQRRRDQILNLREALRLAKALGVESADSLPLVPKKDKAAIEVNTAEVPLYMRGTKALEVEIAVLESRKSDEPFIEGLRDLQEKLSFLEGLSIDRDKLSVVTIDAAARVPYQAEKPKKRLIVMLAAVLGLITGIFLVFIAEFRSKVYVQSNRHSE